ncbi:hypothetical protein AFLA_002898 [Aspergillus flavus NRRL3357]|nr:hypothetical protein AFLA_002898 [Aspergillus flavus NRRL3357]
MIVLRNANAPFAVSELPSPAITEEPTTDPFAGDGHGGAPEKKPIEEFSYDQNRANHNDHQKDNIDDESRGKTFRIQVSAKHLMHASRVFKVSLTGGGKENITFCQQGSVEMTTEGWNLEAFLILLKIIHGQAHDLPQKLSLEMLAMIVDFLVFPTRGPVYKDYRHCHEQKQRVDYSLWPTYPNASNRGHELSQRTQHYKCAQ